MLPPQQGRNDSLRARLAQGRDAVKKRTRCAINFSRPLITKDQTDRYTGLRMLIERGFLNEASVVELADRLGIGPRHLLRLFLRHTGATPSEIAVTRRVQAATADRSDYDAVL
jgi:transcriptional regulator GlxA family with amidase domain